MTDLIAEYERHLSDLGRLPSTIDTYLDVLRRMERRLPYGLASACEDELRDWIYSDSHGPAHRKLCRIIANGFFEWATTPGAERLDFNPVAALPLVSAPKGRPNPISLEQQFEMLARAARPFRDWFLIACFSGARCCELANLDREHITERRIVLDGKGGRPRQVPTHPVLWELAQQLPSGPVATTRCGHRMTRQQVSHRGNYHLQKVLGLEGVHMHRLRKTFGTHAYQSTKDIFAVQQLLGHASPTTTQIYVEIGDEALERAVAGLRVA